MPPRSDEWGMLEYLLALALRSSRGRVKKAWSLDEPAVRDRLRRDVGIREKPPVKFSQNPINNVDRLHEFLHYTET